MVSPASAKKNRGEINGEEAPALGTNRITQEQIESGELSAAEIREAGLKIFATPFNLLDGLGDGPMDPSNPTVPGGRPTLDDNGMFTGYTWEPSDRNGWDGVYDDNIETLFFEGDLGEIFPNFDVFDRRPLDIGFSVGRQPLFFQEGILINDTIDAIGLTKNTILIPGTSNVRVTGIWGWDNVNRNDGIRDDDAELYGLFTSIDFPFSTVDIDLVYVRATERDVEVRDPIDEDEEERRRALELQEDVDALVERLREGIWRWKWSRPNR